MDHHLPLIATLAAAFSVALTLGFLAERLKLPALVGYLLAGILIGPATPGFVADLALASQLSEIGIMLLMFGVGLHFSLADLLAVKGIAVPGAVVQMTLATGLGMLAAESWGWNLGSGLVFGLSLSCASTVVLLKALEARQAIGTMNGRIAVGWLVVEDLATVLVLVLLPALAGVLGAEPGAAAASRPLWMTIAIMLLQVSAFVALMLVVGRRVLPWLLWQVARTGSRELFTLAVVASAIGIAYGAALLFNVSFALGAFFAGMVIRESEFSQRAARESLPMRDAFSVLFFVSVGMLFEPAIVLEEPLRVALVVAIIIVGKSLAAALLVIALRYPLSTALTVSASLAQIGEFSFILAGLGLSLGLLPPEGMSLVLVGALISIAVNPLLFTAIEPFRRWIVERSALARQLEQRSDPTAELPADTERKYLEGQVVLVGYDGVGRAISEALSARKLPYVVTESDRQLVEALRSRGIAAVSGSAVEPSVLIQAHIAEAAMLVVSTPDVLDLGRILATARTLNPDIEIVVRAHSEDESNWLRDEGLARVFMAEEELARAMAAHVAERFAAQEGDETAEA